ncbi:MAG: hypothetical protein V2B20_26215 [Pseudomonadota bacterium]
MTSSPAVLAEASLARRSLGWPVWCLGEGGEPGYTYDRPFDYFRFEFTTLDNRHNPFDNVMLRGFLLG